MQPADRRGAVADFGRGREQIAETYAQSIAQLPRQTRTARFRQGLALTLVGIALTAHGVGAADLDPTFGTSGKVTTDVSGRFDEIRAVMIQSDGRIVAAGVTGAAPHCDFALARYNTDGTLDPAFGDRGTVMTDFAGGDDGAWALAIQPDGKLVVGGVADGDFALARYGVNGALDAQFGIGGRITIDFGRDDRVNALALQSDGRLSRLESAIALISPLLASTQTALPTLHLATTAASSPTVLEVPTLHSLSSCALTAKSSRPAPQEPSPRLGSPSRSTTWMARWTMRSELVG